MKLSKKSWKGKDRDRQEEYYYHKNYGGLDFTVRSDEEIIYDFQRLLDAVYPLVLMKADLRFIEAKALNVLHSWTKIKAAKVVVKGKECEIRLSSDPREFIGW